MTKLNRRTHWVVLVMSALPPAPPLILRHAFGFIGDRVCMTPNSQRSGLGRSVSAVTRQIDSVSRVTFECHRVRYSTFC